MQIKLETPRLYFRELQPSDDAAMFEMDSNPDVHTYLGNTPVKHIDEVRKAIEMIRAQYAANGIGRWAVILKETGAFIGWAGLKLNHNVNRHEQYYDLGYRFMPQYWGKGYATEAAKAFVQYGFEVMKLQKINAYTDVPNLASRAALEKAGLTFMGLFDYEGEEQTWYEIVNPNL